MVFSVEIAEGPWLNMSMKRIRREWGFGDEDARDMATMLKQGYRGATLFFWFIRPCPQFRGSDS